MHAFSRSKKPLVAATLSQNTDVILPGGTARAGLRKGVCIHREVWRQAEVET